MGATVFTVSRPDAPPPSAPQCSAGLQSASDNSAGQGAPHQDLPNAPFKSEISAAPCSVICGPSGDHFPNHLLNDDIFCLLSGPWLHQIFAISEVA